jgi:DNA-binding response OmpR family regulator
VNGDFAKAPGCREWKCDLTRAGDFQLDVLLLTDDADFGSALPALELFAQEVRYAPLSEHAAGRHERADVALIDARFDPAAARNACRGLTAIAPTVAVIAVVSAANFVAVDVDWHFDDVMLAATSAAELHARLRLAIARRRSVLEGTLKFGDLVLHPASYTAEMGDRELELTLTEFKLLNYLVQHAGQAFTRTRLMHEVWGYETNRRARTVDVHVQRLRAKLGAGHESLVDTVRGVGYMAVSPPQPRWIISERAISPLRASHEPPFDASVN